MPSRLLTLVAFLALSTPAFAQSVADEAEAHFQTGAEAYGRGDFSTALLSFMQSNRLSPNPTSAGNVGHTFVAQRKYAEAYRWYSAAKDLAEAKDDKKLYQDAMDGISGRVHLMELQSDPPGATVYLDRKSLGSVAVTPATIAVPPGDYTVIYELDGYEPFTSPELEANGIGNSTRVQQSLKAILAKVVLTGLEGATVTNEQTGEIVGTIPSTVSIAPGPAVLVATKTGYETTKALVTASLEEARTVDMKLDPVDGQVEFTATQRGARIEVDGELVGYTPAVVDLPVGARKATISLDGYQSVALDVAVEDGKRLTVNAPLVPIQQVVTGSGVAEDLIDAPASIVVISAEDIKDRGYDDLAALLRDLPGFDSMPVNGLLYQNNFQRGYRTPFTQRTLLLVDGRVDNHLWTHMANLSRQYPMTMIERVEVLYGPASAVYGANAFSGIINVVTKQAGEDVKFDAKLGYGSFDTRVVDGTLSGTANKIRYSFSGRYFGSKEDNLCGEWAFTNCDHFQDSSLWGAFTDPGNEAVPSSPEEAEQIALRPNPLQYDGVKFYEGYSDPTNDWGARASIGIGGLDITAMGWDRNEGYGAYYASDKAHPGASWGFTSRQLYARYNTDVTPKLSITAEGGWRESRVLGGWAENFGGFLSLTEWHSRSNSINGKVNFNWRPSDNLQVLSGVTLEHKNLNKAYDIPGYYDAFSSATLTSVEDAPATGSDYIYLADQDLEGFRRPPNPLARVPRENIQPTDDIGAFTQVTADFNRLRINAGLRVDHNSFYHRPLFTDGNDFQVADPANPGQTIAKNQVSINPRASVLYKLNENTAIKALYGEAFQEPAPILVWGGWTGRNGNENLIPEKARNVELVGVFRNARVSAEASAYASFYENVIVEQAINTANRQAFGLELRGSFVLANPIPESRDIKIFANYTLSAVRSFSDVDDSGAYVKVDEAVALGDIAPHKLNLGLTLPVGKYLSVHNRVNIVSSRQPYLANALRDTDFGNFSPYGVWNAHLRGGSKKFGIGLTLNNILDNHYLVPGGEGANAGNDISEASKGFNNSAIPVAGRSVLLTMDIAL